MRTLTTFRRCLTYDDVLLSPKKSDIVSRGNVHIASKLSMKLHLNIPFISSNMDTITESKMAIEMARMGGLGIIHRFLSIEDQVKQVQIVKEAKIENFEDLESKRLYHIVSFNDSKFPVGAAVGVKHNDIDRALALSEAGVDCIVIDVAHGHSTLVLNQVKLLKHHLPNMHLIAGNVATGKGALALAEQGADTIKVGVGPGSICTTRIVTGCGVPQLTALLDSSQSLKESGYNDVSIIADGGVKNSGDIVKALAAGADTVMMGNLLAGTFETPGMVISNNGRKVKLIRGMAGIGSNMSNIERQEMKDEDIYDIVPEGVDAQVPYRGKIKHIIEQLAGGLRSGLSYCGAHSIEELRKNAEFIEITNAGRIESSHHDVMV